jgi:hypothetical protein
VSTHTKSIVFVAVVLFSMSGCRAGRAWRAARLEKSKPAPASSDYAADPTVKQAGLEQPAIEDGATASRPPDSSFWSNGRRRAARADRFRFGTPRAGRC